MKRSKLEHKQEIYSYPRSRIFLKPTYKSIFLATYSLENDIEIKRIIEANEYLLKRKFDITPAMFRKLYDKQNGCCAVTGLELPPTRKYDNKSKSLWIGIKQVSKKNCNYELVIYPFAYTWYMRRRVVENIDSKLIENNHVTYTIFRYILDKIDNLVKKYNFDILIRPIQTSTQNSWRRMLHNCLNPRDKWQWQEQFQLSIRTWLLDGLNYKNEQYIEYIDDCFTMVINTEIEISYIAPAYGEEWLFAYRKIPLSDPNVDFIKSSLDLLEMSVLNGFQYLLNGKVWR